MGIISGRIFVGSFGGSNGGLSLFFGINVVNFSMPSGKSSGRIGRGRGGARIEESLNSFMSTSIGNLPVGTTVKVYFCISSHKYL